VASRWRSSLVVLPLCGALVAISACRDGTAAGSTAAIAPAPVIPAVEVTQARTGALPLFERLTGTVRASGEVAIYPEAPGAIVEVLAENGSQVQRGDVLVRIRTAGAAAQVDQAQSALAVARAAQREAEANLEQLEAQYERNATLGEQGLVAADLVTTLRTSVAAARAAVARATAEVAQAQAAVDERRDVASQSVVRAPISGRVGQRNAEVGMRVDPQVPLFIIGRLTNARVEIPVTQDLLGRIRQGQRVEIRLQGRPEPIVAPVSRISPFLAAGSFTGEVEVDVPNDDGALLPGMFVSADLYYGASDEATLVPASALYTQPETGVVGVYVSPSGPAEAPPEESSARIAPSGLAFRPIDVVAEGPDATAVAGVQDGEWVVVVGQHLLAAQSTQDEPQGRVRAIAWDRVMQLQRLQRDDLLRTFMDRQQQLAKASAVKGGAGSE
jgi:RND family efflux transporter MFP subunit